MLEPLRLLSHFIIFGGQEEAVLNGRNRILESFGVRSLYILNKSKKGNLELTRNNQELPLRLELDWVVENQRRDILASWNIESRERMTLSGARYAKHHARHEWK
jgi:hypothetical protein